MNVNSLSNYYKKSLHFSSFYSLLIYYCLIITYPLYLINYFWKVFKHPFLPLWKKLFVEKKEKKSREQPLCASFGQFGWERNERSFNNEEIFFFFFNQSFFITYCFGLSCIELKDQCFYLTWLIDWVLIEGESDFFCFPLSFFYAFWWPLYISCVFWCILMYFSRCFINIICIYL